MRSAHTWIQVATMLVIAWSIWSLSDNVAWGALFLGVVVCTWSILTEFTKPTIRRVAEPDLREVP